MAKRQGVIVGACGEHYVASYLSGMGLVVALTRMGSPATDLFVTAEAGGRAVTLQVKAGGLHSHVMYKRKPERDYWVWRTGKKAIDGAKESHWYAFVFVGDWPQRKGSPNPEVFFVPSKIVARTLRKPKNQRDWFWMYDREIEEYRGLAGYKKLKKALHLAR